MTVLTKTDLSFEDQIPPLSPDSLLVALGRMDEEKYSALVDSIHGADGFKSTTARCQSLSIILGLTLGKTKDILIVLRQLYHVSNPVDSDSDQQPTPVEDVIKSFSHLASLKGDGAKEFKEIIVTRVKHLTTHNDNLENWRKIRRIKSGLINNAIGFSSMVDLRPMFSSDRLSIVGLVPIIQIQIRTDAQATDEQELVFQLSQTGLRDLEKFVEDMRTKIESVKKHEKIVSLLIGDDEITEE